MMRRLICFLLMLGLGAVSYAADEDLLNRAVIEAATAARTSLVGAEKAEGIARIGVAALDGDSVTATKLLQSELTKTDFDIVLTSDVEWGPLLDEFARQLKREDIILEETAHELRVQGVDAVLYGSVERAEVESVITEDEEGRRATVRLMLSLASVSEGNPGSLLWSEQVTGQAEDLAPAALDTRIGTYVERYWPVLGVIAALIGVAIAYLLYRRAIRPV